MKPTNNITSFFLYNSYLIGILISLSFTFWHYLAVSNRSENLEKLITIDAEKNSIIRLMIGKISKITVQALNDNNEDIKNYKNDEKVNLGKEGKKGEKGKKDNNKNDIDNLVIKLEELRGSELAKQIALKNSIEHSSWIFNIFSYTLTIYLLIVFLLLRKRNSLNKLLLEKMEQQNAIFRVLNDSIIVIDINGQVVSANKSFYEFFPDFINQKININGLSEIFNKVDGGPFANNENPFFLAQTQRSFKNVLATFAPRVFDLRWVSISASPIKINDHSVIHIKDITHIIIAQKTIEKHQESLIQGAKFSALGQMAGGIAHEINNPINVINSETEDLKELALDNRLQKNIVLKIIDNIESTSKRVAKIIKGLRVFARSKDKEALQPEYVKNILSDLEGIISARLNKEQISFNILPFEQSLMILCREYQVLQILINVINNAVDALIETAGAADGGTNLNHLNHLNQGKWITVEIVNNIGSVAFLITDSGQGVPKENIHRLFVPFFTTKSAAKGTGLGLSISLGIAKEHGGDLIYHANKKNTCFELLLRKA